MALLAESARVTECPRQTVECHDHGPLLEPKTDKKSLKSRAAVVSSSSGPAGPSYTRITQSVTVTGSRYSRNNLKLTAVLLLIVPTTRNNRVVSFF